MGISSSIGFDVREQSIKTLNGKTLYVGGSGPGNYTKIQDAIDDASDGDTVFVYNGIYVENLFVNKCINLVGESKENTLIDNNESYFNIYIINDGVSVSGFSLLDSSGSWYSTGFDIMANSTLIKNNLIYSKRRFGIIITDWYGYTSFSNNTIIENNLLDGGFRGIYLQRSNNNIISENSISNYEDGLNFENSHDNIISKNNFSNNYRAIDLDYCHSNIISNNTYNENFQSIHIYDWSGDNLIYSNDIKGSKGFSGDEIGVYIVESNGNEIVKNKIYHYKFGVFLENSNSNKIEKNTFLENIINARFINFRYSTNIWNENYWNRPRILPKPIFGIRKTKDIIPGFLEFDWHPAEEPYDIEV